MYWTREAWVYLKSIPDFLTHAGDGDLKLAFMLTQYDPLPSLHHFLSDIAADLPTDPDYVPNPITQIFNIEAEDGLIDLVSQFSLTTVPEMTEGDTVGKIVLYRNTGTASTSPLYMGWSIPIKSLTEHVRFVSFGPLRVMATIQGVV